MPEDCKKNIMDAHGLSDKEASDMLKEVRESGGTPDERVAFAQEKAKDAAREKARLNFSAQQNAVLLADAQAHTKAFKAEHTRSEERV